MYPPAACAHPPRCPRPLRHRHQRLRSPRGAGARARASSRLWQGLWAVTATAARLRRRAGTRALRRRRETVLLPGRMRERSTQRRKRNPGSLQVRVWDYQGPSLSAENLRHSRLYSVETAAEGKGQTRVFNDSWRTRRFINPGNQEEKEIAYSRDMPARHYLIVIPFAVQVVLLCIRSRSPPSIHTISRRPDLQAKLKEGCIIHV